MSTPIVFLDTETTGVHPDRRVWEVAMIRRDEHGEREISLFIEDVDLSNADPFGLKVGRFYDRHPTYAPDSPVSAVFDLHDEQSAAQVVEEWTRGAHIVGVVPSFDAGCLDPMLRRHQLVPAWHYHLVDVEAMAVGYLAGIHGGLSPTDGITPPWKSDVLAAACGVTPPTDDERHTALGDARWAMRWYDAITSRATLEEAPDPDRTWELRPVPCPICVGRSSE